MAKLNNKNIVNMNRDVDYNKIKKIIEEVINKPKEKISRKQKTIRVLKLVLFNIMIPIITAVIAILGHVITFNNSNLTYEYIDETIEEISSLRKPLEFEVKDTNENYTRVPISLTLKVTSGSIKTVYFAKKNYDNEFIYEKCDDENIRKGFFSLSSPTVTIKTDIDHVSQKEVQDIPIWIIIIDNEGNVFIDFYEILCNSILYTSNQMVKINTSNGMLYNYRVVEYNSLLETSFLENAKWADEDGLKDSDFDELEILAEVNKIREKIKSVYY